MVAAAVDAVAAQYAGNSGSGCISVGSGVDVGGGETVVTTVTVTAAMTMTAAETAVAVVAATTTTASPAVAAAAAAATMTTTDQFYFYLLNFFSPHAAPNDVKCEIVPPYVLLRSHLVITPPHITDAVFWFVVVWLFIVCWLFTATECIVLFHFSSLKLPSKTTGYSPFQMFRHGRILSRIPTPLLVLFSVGCCVVSANGGRLKLMPCVPLSMPWLRSVHCWPVGARREEDLR